MVKYITQTHPDGLTRLHTLDYFLEKYEEESHTQAFSGFKIEGQIIERLLIVVSLRA